MSAVALFRSFGAHLPTLPSNNPQIDRSLEHGLPPHQQANSGVERIHVVASQRAQCSSRGGVMACLVAYLDFSPRNHELATALARRYVRTLTELTPDGLQCLELQDRFFNWLAPKVEPGERRGLARRHLRSPASADLRLVGLIDQYRVGGAKATGACPLFRAAHSEHV